MKYKLFIIISIIFSFVILSCAEKEESTTSDADLTWIGTQQLGTNMFDWGVGVATDSSGNVYVAGNTYGNLDGNTNTGWLAGIFEDMFLVKYDSSGTKQWTKQIGTPTIDLGVGVATDSSGNVYVLGNTNGDLDGNTNAGYRDIFVVKYNSSGTKQWTKQIGKGYYDSGTEIATDSSDNVYVLGHTGTNAGDLEMFLVKYDSSGTTQWTQQIGTTTDSGVGVATDSSGNVYVTGDTRYCISCDSIGLGGNIRLGLDDIFLVKYDSSGTMQWTKLFGTWTRDDVLAVTIDSSDNVYVTGATYGGMHGNFQSEGRCCPSDMFLVKYNSSGTLQ
jgi:hypothetical protein